MKKDRHLATESLVLMFVQMITLASGIINAMIMSRLLTKVDYGLYSQGMLIISTFLPFVSLGLSMTINYYFNSNIKAKEKEEIVSTIFKITIISGFICGVIILILSNFIADFFNNNEVKTLLLYIAFRPMLQSIIGLYQPLFISNGFTKTIAKRNLLVSIFTVIITSTVSIFTKNIALIFFLLFILDVFQIIVFGKLYSKKVDSIKVFSFNLKYLKKIVTYTIPISLSVIMGTFLLNMDKLLISKMMSSEDLALYSNMSKELPFNFIVNAITTVLMPMMIYYISTNHINDFKKIWSKYIEFSYLVTWILSTGAIIVSTELVKFLYSDKYMAGVNVFIVYILVVMVRFTYYGVVLLAKEKTKWVLFYSCLTLVLNGLLNYIFFNVFGMIGPAIASFLSVLFIAILQLNHDARLVKLKVSEVIDFKEMIVFIIELFVIAIISYLIKEKFLSLFLKSNFLNLIITYLVFIGMMFLIKKKRILKLFQELNNVN